MQSMPTKDRWIIRHQPNPRAAFRLFCFAYAGGSAAVFRTWSQSLPSVVEVCAVQLPGRESRLKEPPITQLSLLIPALAQALQPYATLPFAFFGHSLGALISFELARWLRQYGYRGPQQLFLSGRPGPEIKDDEPPVHQLPTDEFWAEIRRFNGTPEQVLRSPELMDLLLPVLRADFALNETYAYVQGEPLICPISVFGGLDDHDVSYADLSAWCAYTSGPCSVQMFPGDHFFLHASREALLEELAQQLNKLLRQPTLGPIV